MGTVEAATEAVMVEADLEVEAMEEELGEAKAEAATAEADLEVEEMVERLEAVMEEVEKAEGGRDSEQSEVANPLLKVSSD